MLAAGLVLNQEFSRVLLYLPLYGLFDGLCLKDHKASNGGHRIKWGGKTFLDLDYGDDLSILDESESELNEPSEVLRVMGGHIIKWGGKTFLDLDYGDDLSILDASESKLNEPSEVLRVQGARIGLKINVQKTNSQRLGISENQNVMLGKENIVSGR